MAFSDDAIGFFLQLDDQLTPALAGAEGSYKSFIKSLNTYNQQAYKSLHKGMGAMSALVESFERLPKTATKAYDKAIEAVRKKIKPLTQKIGLEFGPKAEKSLGRAIKQAVSDVFKKLKIRLTATAPLKRSKFFDTSVPMRAFYKTQPQPPDLMGGFQNLPRFAEGGEALGGGKKKGIDDILALLREGEIVLPKDVAGILKEVTKRKALPKGLAASVISIGKLGKELEGLQDAIELGLDPEAPAKFGKSLAKMEKDFQKLFKTAAGMSKGQKAMIPMLKVAKTRMEQFTKEGKRAVPVYKQLLEKILGPAKFIALATALKGAGEGISKLYAGATDAFTQVSGAQVEDYITNMNRVNKLWGLSRDQLRDIKKRGAEAQAALPGAGLTEIGEALEALGRKKFTAEKALGLAPMLALTMRATDASSETLADWSDQLVKVGKLSEDEFKRLTAITVKQARVSGMSADLVFAQTTEKLKAMGQDFFDATDEQKKNMILTMNALQTSLPQGFSSMGSEIQDLVTAASQDTIEGMQKARLAFGMTPQEIRDLMGAGDFEAIFASLTDKFTSVQKPFEAQALATALGLEVQGKELMALGKAMADNNARNAETQKAMRFTGDATKFMSDEAAKTSTLFQRFSDAVQGAAGQVEVFGVSGIEGMDFLKEFNPVAIASIAHLGMMGIKTAIAALKMIFFGATQATTTVAVAGTTVAIQTQNKSLLVSTLSLAKNAAAWVIAKGVLLATTIATHAVTAAQWLWNIAMTANPIGLIIAGVVLLIGGIILLVKNFDVVIDFFKGAFDVVAGFVKSAIDWIGGFGDKLLFLLGPIGAVIFVIKNFGEIWDWLKEKVMGVWDFIVSGISAGIEGVKGIFGSIIGFLMAPLEIVKGFINKWIIGPLNEVVKIDLPLVGPLQDFKLVARIFPLPTLEHGGIAYGPTVAMVGEVPEAIIPLDKLKGVFVGMAEELRQVFLHPLLAARDIEAAIMVKMDPDATDEPVLSAIKEQTAVLMDILAAARAGGPIIVPAVAAGGGARGGRGASATTRGMAGGDF